MPQTDAAGTEGTPLAPSVEKAYYRKCIELKRRLNDVETANDVLRVKRTRLDRAILKMRLERAFLLDQLSKRMDYNVDGSEGSNDETVATPPPDRPHRDKRRRAQPSTPAQANNAQGAQPSSSQPPEANIPHRAQSNGAGAASNYARNMEGVEMHDGKETNGEQGQGGGRASGGGFAAVNQ